MIFFPSSTVPEQPLKLVMVSDAEMEIVTAPVQIVPDNGVQVNPDPGVMLVTPVPAPPLPAMVKT